MIVQPLTVLASLLAQVTVGGLRVEYLTNPIGIDVPQPRLSWWITSPRRGTMQAALDLDFGESFRRGFRRFPDRARGFGQVTDGKRAHFHDYFRVRVRARENSGLSIRTNLRSDAGLVICVGAATIANCLGSALTLTLAGLRVS